MAETGLQGRRIIVTGGASGMGASTVHAYAAQGALVASIDINDLDGHRIAESATKTGPGRVTCVHCDIASKESVDAGFGEATRHLGGLDAIINAAGIAPGTPAESITVEEWDNVFAINMRGTFLTNQAAFRYLKERGGRILNFASAAGAMGLVNKACYSASKGAVLAWTRTIAKEWAKYGITVNAIAPAMRTPMSELTKAGMTPEKRAEFDAFLAREIPLGGKAGDPDRDLAPVMVFLAGEGARFITGQVIAVDGGAFMVR